MEKKLIENNKKEKKRRKEIERKKKIQTMFLIYAQNFVAVWGCMFCWVFSLIWLERSTRMQKVCVRIPVTTAKVV